MGPVEKSVRESIGVGGRLSTPIKGAAFVVRAFQNDGLVLLLGKQEAWTKVPWRALEEIPAFVASHGSVRITGSGYSTDIHEHTLDGYLKQYVNRATSGWIAAVLEKAGVLTIDRSPPSTVRIDPEWSA